MIRSFRCKDTEALFKQRRVPRFHAVETAARRKLLLLHAVTLLEDLNKTPSLNLESLSGNRKGQHSIRVNKQWRICFEWRKDGVYEVEIVDYH